MCKLGQFGQAGEQPLCCAQAARACATAYEWIVGNPEVNPYRSTLQADQIARMLLRAP
jgi:hypothetical protein